MILRICAQATIILIHEEQNISSSIIFCNGYFGIKPYDSSCSGGNLMEKKKTYCGYVDDELLVA